MTWILSFRWLNCQPKTQREQRDKQTAQRARGREGAWHPVIPPRSRRIPRGQRGVGKDPPWSWAENEQIWATYCLVHIWKVQYSSPVIFPIFEMEKQPAEWTGNEQTTLQLCFTSFPFYSQWHPPLQLFLSFTCKTLTDPTNISQSSPCVSK